MKNILYTLVFSTLVFISGCSKGPVERGPAAEATQPASSQQSATPPKALEDAGEYSENVYDMVKVNDWENASAKLALLKGSISRLAPEKQSADAHAALESSLAILNNAVSVKDRKIAMREANQITLHVAELHAPYKMDVPVEITKLDYYGRELEVWAAENNTRKLQNTVVSMRKTWDAVRPAVETRNGKAEAAEFSVLLGKLESSKSPKAYQQLAGPVLDQVDKLEKVFQPSP